MCGRVTSGSEPLVGRNQNVPCHLSKQSVERLSLSLAVVHMLEDVRQKRPQEENSEPVRAVVRLLVQVRIHEGSQLVLLEILPKLFRRPRDLPIMVAGQPEDGSGPVTLPTQPSRERINTRHQFQRLRPGGHEVPWGLQNRLARIIRPEDGHTVMLAADHGYFLGPTHKLEIPRKTLEPLLPFADAIMVTRGVVRASIDPGANVPIVLRVSGGASGLNEHLSNEKVTTAMEEAVRLSASAVALSLFVGAPHEHESLVNLGHLVDEGEEAGLPVLAVTAVGKELEKRDARYLGLATRIAAEFGAHFVKTYFCEPDFDKVVEGCPVPLVVAGGPKLETELDALELAHNSIQAGAAGVDMGRNIWQ